MGINLNEEGFDRFVKPHLDSMIKVELPKEKIKGIEMSIQYIVNDFESNVGDITPALQKGVDYFKDSLYVAAAYNYIIRIGNEKPMEIYNGDTSWQQLKHDITLENITYKNDKRITSDLGHITIKSFRYGTLPSFPNHFIYDPALIGCVDGDVVYLCGYATDTILNVFSEDYKNESDKVRKLFYGFDNLHIVKNYQDLIELN